jgi:hypothetical protein
MSVPTGSQHISGKVDLRIDREMMVALRLAQSPRYVANNPLNSIKGKTMNCWVFELMN